jgi:hypothetical protein
MGSIHTYSQCPDIYCDRSNSNGVVPLVSRGIRILLTLAFVGAEAAKTGGRRRDDSPASIKSALARISLPDGMIEVAERCLAVECHANYVIGAALGARWSVLS